jgi:hypothetical protein
LSLGPAPGEDAETARNPDHASADTVTHGPPAVFESRTSTPAGTKAASTHSVALPPLYEDLNQAGSVAD